jgi:hypothetical protein
MGTRQRMTIMHRERMIKHQHSTTGDMKEVGNAFSQPQELPKQVVKQGS